MDNPECTKNNKKGRKGKQQLGGARLERHPHMHKQFTRHKASTQWAQEEEETLTTIAF
jgi:hypothetical protein